MNEESKKKLGLGRGLSSLLGSSFQDDEDKNLKIKLIELTQIERNIEQPRKLFDQEKIIELANSIEKNGLLQPIIVTYNKNTSLYNIIAGERRFRAFKYLNRREIECIIKDETNNLEILKKAIIENIQREDLTVVEEGLSYKTIIDAGLTHQQLADEIGKSRSHITNTIRITSLPDLILDLISQDKISFGHAKVLLSTTNPLKYYEKLKDGISVRGLEDIIKNDTQKIKNKYEISDLRNKITETAENEENYEIEESQEYIKQKENIKNIEESQEKDEIYNILKDIYKPYNRRKEILDSEEIDLNVEEDLEKENLELKENIKNIESYIKNHFNIDITLKLNDKEESGSLMINYKDFKELENILEKLF